MSRDILQYNGMGVLNNNKKGLIAEFYAIIYLFFSGHAILSWRYKTKYGEIDIIARKGKKSIFFEVKKRKRISALINVVLPHQQRRIKQTAQIYFRNNPQLQNYQRSFDVIFIYEVWRIKKVANCW